MIDTDALRAYVAEFGPKAILTVIAVICEEEAAKHRGRPEATINDIHAGLIRQVMAKMP